MLLLVRGVLVRGGIADLRADLGDVRHGAQGAPVLRFLTGFEWHEEGDGTLDSRLGWCWTDGAGREGGRGIDEEPCLGIRGRQGWGSVEGLISDKKLGTPMLDKDGDGARGEE
jgi:hypothetical protein